jgi:hypothetical protein
MKFSNYPSFQRPIIYALGLALFVGLLGTGTDARADKDDGRLDAAVLKKTKDATVYLRITLQDGRVLEGSGFLGIHTGLVITNAHVLGMLRPESPKPKKVEVIIHSGEANERTFPGKVIGVDSDSDLGLVGVITKTPKELPQSLKVDENKPFQETDGVFIFGFPFGKDLGKNVTVAKSSISSIRKDEKGINIQKIQVNGGMHPGNSGGPVILPTGEVIGVAVSGIKNSNINFAVPARSLAWFLLGRSRNTVLGVSYRDGDDIKVPVYVDMVDPLQNIKEIWYDVWAGDPGAERPASKFKPKDSMPGDSPRTKCLLSYKSGGTTAEGELVLPKLPPKKVWWIQFVYTTKVNKTAFHGAIHYRPRPPVDRSKSATFKFQPQLGGPVWNLNSTASIKIRDDSDVDHLLAVNLTTDMKAADNVVNKSTLTTLQLSKLQVDVTYDKKSIADTKDDADFAKEVALVSTSVKQLEDGRFEPGAFNLRKIPRASQKNWQRITDQLQASLVNVSMGLPSGEVTYGKPWKSTRPLTIFIMGLPQPAVGELTYEYLGTRTRLGRDEAIITFKGDIRGGTGRLISVSGKIKGEAIVDLASGQIINSQSALDVDLDLTIDKEKVRASGTLNARLIRELPKKDK